jgi:hypothetical protein
MGDIVNLRRVRKARARNEKAKEADANRIAFGLSKAEKSFASAHRELHEKRMDQHKLDGPGDDD